MPDSAILYKNADNTVFLIDIPTSIALAQDLSPIQAGVTTPGNQHGSAKQRAPLLSSAPLNKPYPVSSEPKTDIARARLLERIPPAERLYHADIIAPLVRDALCDIRANHPHIQSTWCLPRLTVEPVPDEPRDTAYRPSCLPGDFPLLLDEPAPGDPTPVILAPGAHANLFASSSDVCHAPTRNPSPEPATLHIARVSAQDDTSATFTIPPQSSFVLGRIPLSREGRGPPVPGLPATRQFDLILLDPPWHNRSVRRSRHYRTQSYRAGDTLAQSMGAVLRAHLRPAEGSLAAMWITNSQRARAVVDEALRAAGLFVCEEWVWVKTTVEGEPMVPVEGIWRKPYEVLVVGRRRAAGDPASVTRRVIAAVPDVHSRKPNLREIVETVFAASWGPGSSALEVFARNLTAGWWACGDEVLKFNQDTWWMCMS
ncbi:MT-A70-domain-containing protein [Aspergillus ambiguus]|uniref:MT-A70 family n=1 Tax=Aspergillus ambiguus TaxID=176160 RepID=UPI003CCD62F3